MVYLNFFATKNITSYSLLIFCHYSYKYIQSTFQWTSYQTTITLTIFYFFFFYWTPAIIFEFMDKNCPQLKKNYKYKELNSKYSFYEMVPTVLRNQIIQIILVVFLISKTHIEDFDSSGWGTFKSNLFYYIVIDLFFGGGHFILHLEAFYKPTHALHHATYACQGVSAHFMTFIDFIFESMVAAIFMSTCLLWGFSPISLVSMAAIGSYQTIIGHAGWNLPLNRDPIEHYLHHNYRKKVVNYGLGPIEQILGIWYKPSEEEKEIYKPKK